MKSFNKEVYKISVTQKKMGKYYIKMKSFSPPQSLVRIP